MGSEGTNLAWDAWEAHSMEGFHKEVAASRDLKRQLVLTGRGPQKDDGEAFHAKENNYSFPQSMSGGCGTLITSLGKRY